MVGMQLTDLCYIWRKYFGSKYRNILVVSFTDKIVYTLLERAQEIEDMEVKWNMSDLLDEEELKKLWEIMQVDMPGYIKPHGENCTK